MAKLRGLFLVSFWFILIGIVAPFMILAMLISKNENALYDPARFFIKLGLKLVGVKVVVNGLERIHPQQAYVFTPNHQSFIEVPLFVAFTKRNPAYLAKKELFKYPIFGFGITCMGCVPVDRSNTQAAVESAKLATAKLRQGKSYMVYPEGTRSRDGRLLNFKKGAFIMAIEAGVPVVPVTISGASKIMPKGEFKITPSTVYLTIHEPIPTDRFNKDNIEELMQLTRARILSALDASESRASTASLTRSA